MVGHCAPREEILELARRIVPEYQKDHRGQTAVPPDGTAPETVLVAAGE